MSTRLVALLGAMLAIGALAAGPTLAQMSPPPGNLGAPPRGSSTPAAPAKPPTPAPRAPVQQVAPMASPPLTASPARSSLGAAAAAKPPPKPPVVAPKANSQPQKLPTPPAKPGSPAPTAAAAAAAGAGAAAAAGAAAVPPAPPGTAFPRAPGPSKGTVTGQPLPRWAGILYDGVKLRVGPGQRYPVEWIYRRPDQPVRILREFETWRLVEDHEGVKGWVHQSNLTGRRSFMVAGTDRTLRRSAADDASAVALLKPGVVGRVRSCPASSSWCEVRVGDYRGWLKRDGLWGITADETIGS